MGTTNETRLAAMDRLLTRAAREDAEERRKLLAARTDLAEGLRSHLSTKPLEEVKRYLAAMPDPKAARGLQGAELAEYNRAAKKRAPAPVATHQILADGSMQMNTMSPSEFRALSESTRSTRVPTRGSR